jgi:hypothetical protein
MVRQAHHERIFQAHHERLWENSKRHDKIIPARPELVEGVKERE